MRSPRALGAFGLPVRIDVEDDAGNLPPVAALPLGIEKAQVGYKVFVVVRRKNPVGWRQIGNGRFERG